MKVRYQHINFRAGNPYVELSPRQEQVLIGELLGDGSVRTHATPHAHCSFRWRQQHKEHVILLARVFHNFNPRIGHYSNAWELQLQSNPRWDRERERWYRSTGKHFPGDAWLNPLSCYHWYIGDGSLEHTSPRGLRVALACHDFADESIERLLQILRSAGFGFTRSGPALRCARDARDFLKWIEPPHILECYRYKWPDE